MHCLFLYCCTLQLVLKFHPSALCPPPTLHPSPIQEIIMHLDNGNELTELICPGLLCVCGSGMWASTPLRLCVYVCVCVLECVCARTSPHFLITCSD